MSVEILENAADAAAAEAAASAAAAVAFSPRAGGLSSSPSAHDMSGSVFATHWATPSPPSPPPPRPARIRPQTRLDLPSPDSLTSEAEELAHSSGYGSPPQSPGGTPACAASSPFKDRPLTPREISALVSQVRRSKKYKLRPIWDAAAFGRLSSLTHLDLSRNDLEVLPSSLGKLVHLRNLILTDNLIRLLPPAVANLTQLVTIDISHNQFSSVPTVIARCASLRYADFSSNPISEFAAITTPVIRKLSFGRALADDESGNSTHTIALADKEESVVLPATVCDIPNLEVLKLHSLKLVSLPSIVGRLVSVRHLTLQYSGLESLPDAVASWTAMEILNLEGNKLTSLPDAVGAWASLRYVSLANNELTTLTDAVSGWVSLEVLNVSHNALRTLPPALGECAALEEFSASENDLRELEPALCRLMGLRDLDLNANSLSTLPPELGSLQSLTGLHVSDNNLHSLPASIGSLSSLKVLSARNNQLHALPEEIARLKRLVQLSLDNNILTALPESIGSLKSLQELYVSNNALVTIPVSIGKLSFLKYLYLNNNKVRTLPPDLGHCRALSRLDLFNNPLKKILRDVWVMGVSSILEYLRNPESYDSLRAFHTGRSYADPPRVAFTQLAKQSTLVLDAHGYVQPAEEDPLPSSVYRAPMGLHGPPPASAVMSGVGEDGDGDLGSGRDVGKEEESDDESSDGYATLISMGLDHGLDPDGSGVVGGAVDDEYVDYVGGAGDAGDAGDADYVGDADYAGDIGDGAEDAEEEGEVVPFKRLSFGTSAYSKRAVESVQVVDDLSGGNAGDPFVMGHERMKGLWGERKSGYESSASSSAATTPPPAPAPTPNPTPTAASGGPVGEFTFGQVLKPSSFLAIPSVRGVGGLSLSTRPVASSAPTFPVTGTGVGEFSGGSYQSNLSTVDPTAQNQIVEDLGGPLSEYEIDAKDLELGVKLGEGAFGAVFKGAWDGVEVAAKVLKYDTLPTRSVISGLRHEVAILSKLHHPNVVSLIGACLQPPFLCIVTEYIGGGSLYSLLHTENQRIYLTWLVRIALDVARGMSYLHGSQPKIIHRDLSSHNILIAYPISGANFTAKIADFGLAFVKESNESICTGVTGKVRWVAPEVLLNKEYDEKADVYSYGVVLWEILSGEKPFRLVQPTSSIRDVVAKGGRPPIPKDSPIFLTRLIRECWRQEPARRPSFEDVVKRLMKADRASRRRSLNHLTPLLVDYL